MSQSHIICRLLLYSTCFIIILFDLERVSPGEEEPILEGGLVRKHEWENTTTKASNRSWDKIYAVLRGSQMTFYKDVKTFKSSPEQTHKGETPMQIHGAKASVANDYKKKKHVFRLKYVFIYFNIKLV